MAADGKTNLFFQVSINAKSQELEDQVEGARGAARTLKSRRQLSFSSIAFIEQQHSTTLKGQKKKASKAAADGDASTAATPTPAASEAGNNGED